MSTHSQHDHDGRELKRLQRVQYVGLSGERSGPVGTVRAIFKTGVRVKWDDGRVEVYHPHDVRILQ